MDAISLINKRVELDCVNLDNITVLHIAAQVKILRTMGDSFESIDPFD